MHFYIHCRGGWAMDVLFVDAAGRRFLYTLFAITKFNCFLASVMSTHVTFACTQSPASVGTGAYALHYIGNGTRPAPKPSILRQTLPFFKTGHSTLGGTMSIDSKWTAFERLIPSALHTKKGRVVNEKLYTYLYAAVYRLNHKDEDGFKLICGRFAS